MTTAHGVDRSGAASGSGEAQAAFIDTFLDADTVAAALDALNVSTFMQTVLDDTTAAAARATLDAQEDVITTAGDIVVGAAAGTAARKAVGTDGYSLHSQAGASDKLQYLPPMAGYSLLNGYLDWSVSGNVLTIAVKTWAGATPSATDPVYIVFRDANAGIGLPVLRKLTAATTISINNTATLGTASSTPFRLWAIAFDDGGTVRLGVINCLSATSVYPLAGWGVTSSTQESDTADSAQVFYTDGAAVTSKSYAVLGYGAWEITTLTAGVWASGPDRNQLFGPGIPLPGVIIQIRRNQDGAVGTTSATIPNDDSIPQNTEGAQFMSQAITPNSACNVLQVDHVGVWGCNVDTEITTIALFKDSVADALTAVQAPSASGGNASIGSIPLIARLLAAQLTEITFKIRAGPVTGTSVVTFNGGGSARKYGGVAGSWLEVSEIMT